MKKIKKLLALGTLIFFVLGSYTGCSNSSSGSGKTGKDPAEVVDNGSGDEDKGDNDEKDGQDKDNSGDEEEKKLTENPELSDLVPDAQELGEFTAAEAIAKIDSMESGNYAIKITGTITTEDIEDLRDVMFSKADRNIALDLRGTSGLTKLADRGFIKNGIDERGYNCLIGAPLSAIILPECITEIGDLCFYNCTKLKAIVAPGVTILRQQVFQDCKVLTILKFADEMELLEESAIAWVPSITEITLNAKKVGHRMLSGCDKLTKVIIGPAVEEFDDEPFTDCTTVKEFIVAEGNTHFKAVDGVLFTADGKHLIRFPPACNKTEYSLPAEVTSMNGYGFAYSKLKKVEIPGIKNIPEMAFFYANALSEVSMPIVETIGYGAFDGTALSSIKLPSTLKSIDRQAFGRLENLEYIYIPSSVTSMGKYVFYGWGEKIQIYCQEASKPDGWDENWNKDSWDDIFIPDDKIHWGVNPEE